MIEPATTDQATAGLRGSSEIVVDGEQRLEEVASASSVVYNGLPRGGDGEDWT